MINSSMQFDYLYDLICFLASSNYIGCDKYDKCVKTIGIFSHLIQANGNFVCSVKCSHVQCTLVLLMNGFLQSDFVNL